MLLLCLLSNNIVEHMFKLNNGQNIALNTFVRYILRISYCSHILYFNTVDVLISIWFYHIMYKNRVKLNRSRVTQYIYCDNLNLFTYATTSHIIGCTVFDFK